MNKIREQLKKLKDGTRYTFKGTFQHNGLKSTDYVDKMGNTRYQPTFMLTDIYQIDTDGKEHYVADHLWMNLTKLFLKYGWLEKGDLVQFDGKVVEYITQRKNDFKIERPSKVIITRSEVMIPHTDSLINLRPLEIEQRINLQNKPYTEARDTMLSFFSLHKFHALEKKWRDIQAYVLLDKQLFTRDSFRECYYTRESMIELHHQYLHGKISVEKFVYNGKTIPKNLITDNEIKSYLSEYTEQLAEQRKLREQTYEDGLESYYF